MDQSEGPIWGKLIPLAKGLGGYSLKRAKTIIGRTRGHIIINQTRLSKEHCLIQRLQNGKVQLVDLSTNGTYYNHNYEKIGKNNRVEMKDGDQVWLLPISRVNQNETIGFRLGVIEPAKKDEHKQETQKFISSVIEQITCPYCSDIMVYPVITQPCNHRFCGPCLTLLVNKKKGQCIICRKQLSSASRDATFSAIIDDYFRHNPDQKRRDQDEEPNIFGFTPTDIKPIILGCDQPETKPELSNPGSDNDGLMKAEGPPLSRVDSFQDINSRGRGRGRGRPNGHNKPRKPKKASKFINSDISASTDSDVEMTAITLNQAKVCKQCSEPRNGFKCKPTQRHIKCHNCSKPFAIRQDQKFHQCCTICRSYFCNLYMPPCQKNGPKLALLGNRGPTCKIEPIFFRNNKVEMNAFTNLLMAQKKNLKQMFTEMLDLAQVDKFRYRFDRQILPNTPKVNRQVSIHKSSPICDNCWRDLWFQMIFTYFNQYRADLPEPIRNRPACYWGVNCHTMSHNVEHAKKYNHMKQQTKFFS